MTPAGGRAEDIVPRQESTEGGPGSGTGGIEVTLTGDRRDVEAMALEFHRLAKAYGLEIGAVRILAADVPPPEDAGRGGSA